MHTMKILYPFIFGLAIMSSSCGSDGNDSCAGRYEISQLISNCDGDFDLDLSGDGCDEVMGFELCVVGAFVLNEDGSMTASMTIEIDGAADDELFEQVTNGSWVDNGSTLLLCNDSDASDCLMATKNGKTLSFNIDDGDCQITLELEKV